MPHRRRRFISTIATALALMAFVGATTALAATKSPASLTITSVDPATSDAGAYNFTIGFAGADDPNAGFVNGAKSGHCIENGIPEANTADAILRTGAQGADLTLPAGSLAAAPGGRDRLQWLLLSSANSRATGTGAQRDFEAAAHQLAIWFLTTPPGGPAVVASDPAAITRANVLLAGSATNGAAASVAPTLTPVGPDVCDQTSRQVTVTGAPLTTATVTVTSGTATLTGGTPSANGQSTIVTLGADGIAAISVNTTAAGAVGISATFTAFTLVQVDAGENQDFAYLEPRTVTVPATVNFTVCTTPTTPTAPGTPTTPVVIGTQTTRLAITKTAPSIVRAGRTINYVIRVRNRTGVAARNVVVTDILPGGTSVVSANGNATIKNARVVWVIPTLGATQTRTLTLKLRVDNNVTRPRCNAAMAKGDNAPRVMARVCTAVIAGAQFQPIVTG